MTAMETRCELRESSPRGGWGSPAEYASFPQQCLVMIRAATAESLPSCPTCPLCSPIDCSPPGSAVHGTLQQKYWSVLPFPSPGDLPDPGIKPVSLMSPALASGFFTTSAPWEAHDDPWQLFTRAAHLSLGIQGSLLVVSGVGTLCPACTSSRLAAGKQVGSAKTILLV